MTNLSENQNISELVDNCLAKNKRKTLNILNENNFAPEDCILITRIFLTKLKKLDDANSAFKKVIELEPENIDAWIDYSNFLFDNISKSEALAEVEKGIRFNKNNFDLKLRRHKTY